MGKGSQYRNKILLCFFHRICPVDEDSRNAGIELGRRVGRRVGFFREKASMTIWSHLQAAATTKIMTCHCVFGCCWQSYNLCKNNTGSKKIP